MRLRASERLQTPLITVWGVEALPAARRVFFSYLSSGVGLPAKFALAATLYWFEKVEKKGKLVPLRFEFLSSKPAKVSFSESLFQYWLVLTTQPSSLLDLKTQTEVLRSLLDWNCLKHFLYSDFLFIYIYFLLTHYFLKTQWNERCISQVLIMC